MLTSGCNGYKVGDIVTGVTKRYFYKIVAEEDNYASLKIIGDVGTPGISRIHPKVIGAVYHRVDLAYYVLHHEPTYDPTIEYEYYPEEILGEL